MTSCTRYVYCGPYVKCDPYTYADEDCDDGERMDTEEAVQVVENRLWAVFGDCDGEPSLMEDVVVLIPHALHEEPLEYPFLDAESDPDLRSVQPADIEAQCKAFSERYTPELEVLRARFGPDKVTVEWGILQQVWD